jgi:DNA-binding MarR family transcriptional regulator
MVRRPNGANTSNTAAERPSLTMAEMLEQPGYLIRRLHQLSTAAFMTETEGHDITPIQFSALLVIGTFPNADASKISDIIAFDRTTVGQVLLRLEQKGLIVREQGKDDKRRKNLTLTDEGARIVHDVSQYIPRVEKRIVGRLGARERAQLVKLLQKLVAPDLHVAD